MNWTTKPLAQVAEFCLGKMLDDKKNKGDPLPYLANINVRWGSFDLENLREMRFEHDEMDRYGLKYGDIVMCEGGEPGRCAIWKESVSGMMIQKALHRIRPHDCLDYRFLFYSFLHKGRNGSFAPLFTGATIKHLPREKLAKVEIAYPRLDVQRRIADILSSFDDLIENNRRRMSLLEDAARMLFDEWFVRLRFPGSEHVHIQDGLPDGWAVTDLESACLSSKGIQTGPFGSQLHQSDYSEDGTPVVMPKDILGSRISVDSIARIPESVRDRLARHILRKGDIVLARRGDIGRMALVTEREIGWLCGTGCIRLRPNPEVVHARFLFDTLGRPEVVGLISNRAQGAIMPNLNLSILAEVPILLPPRPMQFLFQEQVGPMHRLVGLLAKQVDGLRAARDLLLPRLVSGDLSI